MATNFSNGNIWSNWLQSGHGLYP